MLPYEPFAGIPHKLFSRLCDDLLEYRTNPCKRTYEQMTAMQDEVGFPWGLSKEQTDEWQSICDRTRAEFEAKAAIARAEGLTLQKAIEAACATYQVFGPVEPPQDPMIYNRRQPDGTHKPLSGFFNGEN